MSTLPNFLRPKDDTVDFMGLVNFSQENVNFYLAGMRHAAWIAQQTNKGKAVSEAILAKAIRYEMQANDGGLK